MTSPTRTIGIIASPVFFSAPLAHVPSVKSIRYPSLHRQTCLHSEFDTHPGPVSEHGKFARLKFESESPKLNISVVFMYLILRFLKNISLHFATSPKKFKSKPSYENQIYVLKGVHLKKFLNLDGLPFWQTKRSGEHLHVFPKQTRFLSSLQVSASF